MDATTTDRSYTDEELDREWKPKSRRPLSTGRYSPICLLYSLLSSHLVSFSPSSSIRQSVENALDQPAKQSQYHSQRATANTTAKSPTMDYQHEIQQSEKQQRRLTLNSDDRTVARSFSDELMNIFRIDNSVADLDQQVDTRRAKVNRNTMELASLEARLREMEERLKKSQQSRPDLQLNTSDMPKHAPTHAPPPPPDKDDKARSRPGTARAPKQAPSAGTMPPTPGGSEGKYHFVTKADCQ
ncbi:hypothetical protein ARSEF1564_000073 [Beauveria bassiana]